MVTEPDDIVVGSTRYVRDGGLLAVSLADDREAPPHSLWVTEAPRLAVLPKDDAAGLPAFGPVYRAEPAGTLAVPTGRIFVRFEDALGTTESATILRDSGYRVEDVPSWAPNSAWVVRTEGGVAEALRGISVLGAHSGVSHVEPELLRPMAKRTSRM